MLSSPRSPDSTMRIFSSAVNCRRVTRRISFTTCSAGFLTGPDFCPIFAPSMATMGQKSSLLQLSQSVSWALMPDTVYFLTGLSMEDEYTDQIINEGRRCDVWGDRNPIVLVRRFYKSTLTPFYEAVRQLAETARITDEIEINTKGVGITLDENEMRLLRSFARRQNGVCIDIEMLSDGLSG